MLPDSPEYARLLAPFTDGTPALRDAWHLAHPGQPHAPTVGLHKARLAILNPRYRLLA